jgi:serine/threonine protein kinase
MLRGGILSESDNSNTIARPEMVGRVLYERFLVESDLTHEAIGSGFVSYSVKDLKNFCRDVTFKTLTAQQQAIVGGPTFQHVCEALTRLGHPNIEQVLETGLLFDGRPYAVTQIPAGRTLAEVVRDEGRLELERVSWIIDQLSDALAAAHSTKVLHCDIKPSNVVVTERDNGPGQVCLINFGAAWPVDVRGATLENLQAGSESLSYAAPELHAKLGHRSTASDIYSLAAVAYRLIVGRVPFAGEDRVSLLRAINAGVTIRPTDCRTDLSGEAEQLILSALQFEPAWRPQHADDFGIRLIRSLRPAPRPATSIVQQLPEEPQPAAGWNGNQGRISEAVKVHTELFGDLQEPKPESPPISDRAVAWALIVLLLAGALSIPIGQTLMAEEKTTQPKSSTRAAPAESRPKVQIRYWFEQPPAQARASEMVGASQLVLNASSAGGLFVIGESETAEGNSSYRLIHSAEDPVETDAEKALRVGTREGERLWIVWTPSGRDELADVRRTADANGTIPDREAGKLGHFLERNRGLRVAATLDGSTGQTVLSGSGERLVYRIQPDVQ